MKIGFHSNQLGLRGTEVALYEYALGNQQVLGNESIVFAPKRSDLTTYDKFSKVLPVYLYDDFSELEGFGLDWCYFIKYGTNDGKLLKSAKNFVHAVFNVNEPHGDVYAYVSEWLGEIYNAPFLPHIVTPSNSTQNFRKPLNIPEDAVVFGRYGGYDQFDYPWVKDTIKTIVEQHSNIYFLFLNTAKFIDHPKVLFFGGTDSIDKKTAFINTCDAMLHARSEGESFGLSICEFLAQNKPVITNPEGRDKNHLKVLGDKGFYYTNSNELHSILTNFTPSGEDYTSLVSPFTSKKVMSKFQNLIK